MKLLGSLTLLSTVLAADYEYDDLGNKKKNKVQKEIERDNALLDGSKI